VFLDVGVDTSTSVGRLVRNMASLAEWESDRIPDTWTDIYRYLARQGRRNGGYSTPLGYRYEKSSKNYVVVPEEAATVREVFRRFVQGESTGSIVRDLNRRGVPTKTGKTWHVTTANHMLQCEMLAGLRRFDGELIERAWVPIVERDILDRARSRREQQRAGFNRSTRGRYLLSGLLRCASVWCGYAP
jgi:site-specific DNA recombinase